MPPGDTFTRCKVFSEPHVITFGGGADRMFHHEGLYELAHFTIAPCGCEVVIQAFIDKYNDNLGYNNAATAAIAVRVGATTFEFTGNGDVRSGALFRSVNDMLGPVQHLCGGGCTLERSVPDHADFSGGGNTDREGQAGWRLYLPGGAGNILVVPYKLTGTPGGVEKDWQDTWIKVAQSVIDMPGCTTGLCHDNSCGDTTYSDPDFSCDFSQPQQCRAVLKADAIFSRSALSQLEVERGVNPSTRDCIGRRLQSNELPSQPPAAASNDSYITACAAAGINPDTVLASCDAGCGRGMAESCVYDYCLTGDSAFFNRYKDICAIDNSEMLQDCKDECSKDQVADKETCTKSCEAKYKSPPPPKTYRPIQPLWGGQCAIPGQSVSSYCCSYTDPTLNTQQDCENKCNADAKCVAYSWKISYTDCQVYDATGLPDLDAVVGSRSLSPPQGHWDASCYVVVPPPPPSSAVLTLTASGSVSDYTESDRSSLQQKVANVAGVDKSLVKIKVAGGSVLITATIAVPASMTAEQVKTSLSSSLGTAEAASIALGITVEAVPTIIITGPSPSPPPSPLTPCERQQECTDECASDHVVCKSGCAGKKKCKKYCKKNKKKCKNACESFFKCPNPPSPPPPCEDNTIPGFGSRWCEMNAPDPSFCSNEAQMNKCKKTCGLCG